MTLQDEWNALDSAHKEFILRVRNSNGSKYGAEPASIDSVIRHDPPNEEYFKSIALWELAESSGFIKCLGSYKWIVTPKFNDLERLVFGVE